MAYEYNAESAQSILTQTAFKGAVDLTVGGYAEYADFSNTFNYLRGILVAAEAEAVVSARKTNVAEVKAATSNSQAAVAKLKKEFGGGTVVDDEGHTFNLRIITDESETQGPHPDWLYEEAAKRGVRAVKDQRTWASEPSKSGKPRPWYVIAPDLPRGVSDEVKREAWNKAKGLYAPDAA